MAGFKNFAIQKELNVCTNTFKIFLAVFKERKKHFERLANAGMYFFDFGVYVCDFWQCIHIWRRLPAIVFSYLICFVVSPHPVHFIFFIFLLYHKNIKRALPINLKMTCTD
jgi:hypothetical protein